MIVGAPGVAAFLCSTIRFDAPELIAAEPENLRVLKEHELGVKLGYDPDGGGPYVTEGEEWAGTRNICRSADAPNSRVA